MYSTQEVRRRGKLPQFEKLIRQCNQSELRQDLLSLLKNPLTLKALCRIAVRDVDHLDSLCHMLPCSLEQYLRFKEL